MSNNDDKQGPNPFHSGHTQVLGEGEGLPGFDPSPQGQMKPPGQSQQYNSNQNWSAHTTALPPEAFDGLQRTAGPAPTPQSGGNTMAMDPNSMPGGGGGQSKVPPPPAGMGGPMPQSQHSPPPSQSQPQGGPPGGVPYLETQALSPEQIQNAMPQYSPSPAPPSNAGSGSGGGVVGSTPYLETQAIDINASGHGAQPSYAPPQHNPAPPHHAPPQHSPPGQAPSTPYLETQAIDVSASGHSPAQSHSAEGDESEHAPTMLIDTSSINLDQPPPRQSPPPSHTPPAPKGQFDSNNMAIGGEKTVIIQDLPSEALPPGMGANQLHAGPSAGASTSRGWLMIFVPDLEPIPFELLPGITTIGRGMENHLVLGDPYASRKHMMITCRSGQYFFEDTRSDNGTMLNGQMTQRKQLATGDVIQIGSVSMRFVAGDIQPHHHQRPAAPSRTATVPAPPPQAPVAQTKSGGGNKAQVILLSLLVVATLALIAVIVVLAMSKK
ncbi:MAG: FHA domain-containing protein [Myxococcales bacterium]|nr:FHA domain-containing protein [Myxococcales bacterium]